MAGAGKTRRLDDKVKSEALAVLAEGDLAMSAGALSDAARLLPEDPEIAFHLGTVMLRLDQPDAAAFHLERARGKAPEVTAIHCNLATALLKMDDVENAIAVAEEGLQRQPDDAPLNNVLANTLFEAGRLELAAENYERALRSDPEFRTARTNLANVRRDLGETPLARRLYDQTLEGDAGDVEALIGLASLERDAGDIEAAMGLYRRALEAAPGQVRALNNLGILLMEGGEWHEAHALFRDSADLWRESAEIHGNLAQCLQAMGRHDEAVEMFDYALALDPEARRLRPYQLQSLLHQCDWDRVETLETRVLRDAEAGLAAGEGGDCPPFVLAQTQASPALRRRVAEDYSRRLVQGLGAAVRLHSHGHDRETAEPLRVGFISPDFRQHSLAMSFSGLLGAFDRQDFDWHGYSLARDEEDAWTDRFRRDFHHFHRLTGLPPREAARRIHDDRIDLLIDLAGHTRHSALEILAFRPAPIQAHYLGQATTLGAEWIDYLFTDPVHTPPELEPHVSEALVRLPTSFMASEVPEIAPPMDRAQVGLPDIGVVMACFNAHAKIHPEVFHVWMRLMRRLPDSFLWLGPGGDRARANRAREAERHLVDSRRLIFAERWRRPTHLARLANADLVLDTSPHAGGVTTLDALWAGVPVATLAGEAPAARTGASILASMGLDDLIADDPQGYEAIAHRLAADAAHRGEMRARVQAARETSPTFDPPALARHLEWAFREMARRRRDGLPPASFDVPRLDIADPRGNT